VDVGVVSSVVFFFCFPWSLFGVDCNVVHVHRKPALGHLLAEYHVYHHLECGRGVGEAKEHHGGFEEALWHKKSSFPLIPWLNLNVVVPLANIKLSKKGAAAVLTDGYKGMIWTLINSDKDAYVLEKFVPHLMPFFVIYAGSSSKDQWSHLHKTTKQVVVVINPWTQSEMHRV
jgi:hypothetical protein